MATPLLAEKSVYATAPATPDLDGYVKAVRDAGDDPSKLRGTTGVVLNDTELVPLEIGWTRWEASPASRETLTALEGRVEAATYVRPTAFRPEEIRRRLSNLLDRLYPSRVRALGAAADEPVRSDPVLWTHGTWVGAGPGGGSGYGAGHGAETGGGYGGGRPGGTSYASAGSSGGSSSGSSGGGSSVDNHVTYQRHDPVRPTHHSVQQTQGTQVQTNPVQTQPVRPPPPQMIYNPTTQPAQTIQSHPTEVALTPPPKPPAVEPPPPPPTQVVKPETKSTSWVTVLFAVLLAALPLAAYMYWRSRRKPAPPPPVTAPRSVADLVDPEHVGLGSIALGQIGRKSAEEEDWMRAMRYLFAALLTFLAEQRRVPIRDFHTNREIANLVARDATLAENFWSAATIFELFWFGQRRPMENDFRLFETMARECMSRLEVSA